MKDILKSTAVLLIIALVAGFLLGFVNNLTSSPIAKRAETQKEVSLNNVIDDENKISLDHLLVEDFKSDYEGVTINEAYPYVDEYGEFKGIVAIVTTTEGYKDDIKLSVGIEMVSKISKAGEICGVDFLSINETPGLGMNVKDEAYLSQYIGKSSKLEVSKNAVSDNQIDTVSGATITSEAVTDAINAVLEFYNSYIGVEVK